MAILGLALICVGWIIQYRSGKKLHTMFVGSYTAGVALLVLDDYEGSLTLPLALNLVSLIIASFVLWNIIKKK